MLFRCFLSVIAVLSTDAVAQEGGALNIASREEAVVLDVSGDCELSALQVGSQRDHESCIPAEPARTRGGENAITQASDAFGFDSGKESIGLYSTSNVRGFSPISAGNVRIDGLYFDQVFGLTNRVRESSSIRVGLSAMGRPFPAPTGIVDYLLYKPDDEDMHSALVSVDSYGAVTLESDFVLPIGQDGLSLGGGFYFADQRSHDGATSFRDIQGLIVRWAPSIHFDTTVFWTRSSIANDERTPRYVPSGSFLPPAVKLQEYNGPDWAVYNSVGQTFGAKSSIQIGESWQLKGGLFRSRLDDSSDFVQLYRDMDQDGNARRIIIADPPSWSSSTSGEVRLSKIISDGPRLHVLSFGVWARDRDQIYGGADSMDFGPISIGEDAPLPLPELTFGEHSADAIKQWTAGPSYSGNWSDWAELNIGLGRTQYSKEVRLPGVAVSSSQSNTWIYHGSLSVRLAASLTAFASVMNGLEESGVAPDNATNRNEPLPAILTNQREIGLSYKIAPNLKILADVFELKKPYYNSNQAGRFVLLGEVRNLGLELSLAGELNSRINIVAGAVLLDPVVTGEDVSLGRIGKRPVGLARQTLMFNLNWKPLRTDQLSLDLSVTHNSSIVATRDNLVSLSPRTLVDIGMRYRLQLLGGNSTLRVRLTNLTGKKGFELRGAGAYDIIPGRQLTAYLAHTF